MVCDHLRELLCGKNTEREKMAQNTEKNTLQALLHLQGDYQ